MIPFRLDGDDAKQDSPLKAIIQGALGKASILSDAPTQAENSISEGELGFYNGVLYLKISGVLYSVNLSTVA